MKQGWAIAFIVGLSLTPISSGWALSPSAPVTLLPIVPSADGAVGGVRFSIEKDGVEEVDVVMRLISARQTLSTQTAGVSVIARDALPSGARVPDGSVVAGRGSIVELPRAHTLSLAPGAYAEYVQITVIKKGGEPFELAGFRYFEVTASGLAPLTIDEYSQRTQVVQTAPDGKKFVAGGLTTQPPRADDTAVGFDIAVAKPSGAP